MECGVMESAKRGLLGDLSALELAGDGSPMPTAADGNGTRVCECKARTHCECDRRYSDPDARWGYDSYRKHYFFGHHLYELATHHNHLDLPIYVRLDPGNETDHTASLKAVEWTIKYSRDHTQDANINVFIGDKGHDSKSAYQYYYNLDISTVIPLSGKAPAAHPTRKELKLSKRGIPLCQAGIEMASRGSGGTGKNKTILFSCPLRAKKIETCPLSPPKDSHWHCTGMKFGPVVAIKSSDDLRLFPKIARNSARYRRLYAKRSGTERNNNVKKSGYRLLECRHRRASLWHIRIVLAALMQHAKAWIAGQDPISFIHSLMGTQEECLT